MPMRPTLLRHAAALALATHIAWPVAAQTVDDADGYGNVATPMAFTVTVGARSQTFAITDPVGDAPFASTLVLGAGFTVSSLRLQVHRFDTATMLSEVQISAVPEPASAALLAAGADQLLARRRRSQA